MAKTVTVTTPKCMVCSETSTMELDAKSYDNYTLGMFVQQAFPLMSVDDRELLLTGTHPNCWDSMFASVDDYEEA